MYEASKGVNAYEGMNVWMCHRGFLSEVFGVTDPFLHRYRSTSFLGAMTSLTGHAEFFASPWSPLRFPGGRPASFCRLVEVVSSGYSR